MHQGWVIWQTIFAPRPSKVDSLAFAWRDPSGECAPDNLDSLRLFSAGGGSELTEWDLVRCSARRSLPSQGGSIWSIAVNPTSTALALGCEDGCVRMVSLEDDSFVLHRKFDRVKAKILSIAWGPPTRRAKTSMAGSDVESDDEDAWVDQWLVTGCSDSSLRKWDVRSGRMVDRMSTDKTRSEKTLVWAVGVLGDGKIISGDSMGMVKFWDSRTCTQLHSYTSHGADVLCMAINHWSNAVYTSGVDQKVAEFLPVEISAGKPSILSSGKQNRWIQSKARRLHSHDVRALAIWPPQSLFPAAASAKSNAVTGDIPPLLVSAGLDMSPVTIPCAPPNQNPSKYANPFGKSNLATFEEAYCSRAPFTRSVIAVAGHARLVACRNDSRVSVWRIKEPPNEVDEEVMKEIPDGWVKLLDLQLNTATTLSALALSADGRWLAVADANEVKLFLLRKDGSTLQPKRIKTIATIIKDSLPSSCSGGATSLIFSPDSSKLIVGLAQSGYVVVLSLDTRSNPLVLRVFDQHRHLDSRTRLLKPLSTSSSMDIDDADEQNLIVTHISNLATSLDGQWLASSDVLGRINVFNLDALHFHCALPTFPYPISALAFDAFSSRYLVVATPDNAIRVYDVERRLFPEWQREMSRLVSKKLGTQRISIMGLQFLPIATNSDRAQSPTKRSPLEYQTIVMWGPTWICRFRMHTSSLGVSGGTHGSSKRKRDEDHPDSQDENEQGDSDEENVMGEDEDEGKKDNEKKGRPFENKTLSRMALTMTDKYRNLLGVQFLNAEEMIVVERPLLDVLSTLPPAYFKPKYGS
ncbi:related to UTP4-U3 snoRNP protein [Serendipita indica DSM 11827]|uniref:Related to UTP4-U3 snoRNP protein n=1 Tax=Serendipita indica (strain DSM 11827) TaxID=1109443 RepID=G4TL11_SERID|nr:related to UTP4-U3 snoRNP protein [Serendipita indica DSM 11827]